MRGMSKYNRVEKCLFIFYNLLLNRQLGIDEAVEALECSNVEISRCKKQLNIFFYKSNIKMTIKFDRTEKVYRIKKKDRKDLLPKSTIYSFLS